MADKDNDFELDAETLRQIEEDALKAVEGDFELDEETLKEIEAQALREAGLAPAPSAPAPAPAPVAPPAPAAPAPTAAAPPPVPAAPAPTPAAAAPAAPPAPTSTAAAPAAVPAKDQAMQVAPKAKAPAVEAPKAAEPPPPPPAEAPKAGDEAAAGEKTLVMADGAAPTKDPGSQTLSGGKKKKRAVGGGKVGGSTITTDKAALQKMRRGTSLAVADAQQARKSGKTMLWVFLGCFAVLGIIGGVLIVNSMNKVTPSSPTAPSGVPPKSEFQINAELEKQKETELRKLNVELRGIAAKQTAENVQRGVMLIEEFMAKYPGYETAPLESKLAGFRNWLSMNSMAPPADE